jgi:hypothetical protein
MVDVSDGGDMGKEDRRRVVLDFMGEYPVALRPAEIYRNLRYHRRITFSKESVDNYIEEFVEEGLVLRVKPQSLEMGQIEEAPPDQRAYYIISEEGQEHLQSENN